MKKKIFVIKIMVLTLVACKTLVKDNQRVIKYGKYHASDVDYYGGSSVLEINANFGFSLKDRYSMNACENNGDYQVQGNKLIVKQAQSKLGEYQVADCLVDSTKIRFNVCGVSGKGLPFVNLLNIGVTDLDGLFEVEVDEKTNKEICFEFVGHKTYCILTKELEGKEVKVTLYEKKHSCFDKKMKFKIVNDSTLMDKDKNIYHWIGDSADNG